MAKQRAAMATFVYCRLQETFILRGDVLTCRRVVSSIQLPETSLCEQDSTICLGSYQKHILKLIETQFHINVLQKKPHSQKNYWQ